MEARQLLAVQPIYVTNSADDPTSPVPGSLRAAIIRANSLAPVPQEIVFDIPAAIDSDLRVPEAGFDPATQTWTIHLGTALPTIVNSVTIDGYSQAHAGVPFRYPGAFSSSSQVVSLTGIVTGGTFTLTAPMANPPTTTGPIAFDASPAQVQAALSALPGLVGNLTVGGSPGAYTITFQNALGYDALPDLTGDPSGLVGTSPGILVQTTVVGGLNISDPMIINSAPNQRQAVNGNDGRPRLIIDGYDAGTGQYTAGAGLDVRATNCQIRGLVIEGFGTGIVVEPGTTSNPTEGNVIQGNYIGTYPTYLVDTTSGQPLPALHNIAVLGHGIEGRGLLISGDNATVGGPNPQECNVIAGAGAEGILITSEATGVVIENSQIGVLGPLNNGLLYLVGNGADGVYDLGPSNAIGMPGAGNVIACSAGSGIHVRGDAAINPTRTIIAANHIGLGANNQVVFGSDNPGNGGNGILIEDATQNQIGGPDQTWSNAISSNHLAGVEIRGAGSTGNLLSWNMIGLIPDGTALRGNLGPGILLTSPQNTVGPANVISGNDRGIVIRGTDAYRVSIIDNLVGTDVTGKYDFGNAEEGILIDGGAWGVTISGNAQGSQVISGNHIGISVQGTATLPDLITGNFIGTDISGLFPIPNARQGVLITGSSSNTIGGTTAGTANLISGNHWGVQLDGGTTSTLLEGNLIGTDISGSVALPNEVHGVRITAGASGNTVGGTVSGASNIIAYNVQTGISVETADCVGNSILSNSIHDNARPGIALVDPGIVPTLNYAVSNGSTTRISFTLNGQLNIPYLVQFFINSTPVTLDAQGQFGFGSDVFTPGVTNTFFLDVAAPYPPNVLLTATATNLLAETARPGGQTSAFSSAIVQYSAVMFAQASYSVDVSDGQATISLLRTIGKGAADGTYRAEGLPSGSFHFADGQTTATFAITVPTPPAGGSLTIQMGLVTVVDPSYPSVIEIRSTAALIVTQNSSGAANDFVVTTTADDPGNPVRGMLRYAIIAANNVAPSPRNITFAMNAAVGGPGDPNLIQKTPGFDPITQTWTITLAAELPAIINTVSIDGFSQAHNAVLFRYPDAVSSAVQSVVIGGTLTGGFFTLTVPSNFPFGISGTTGPIAYNASPTQVTTALTTAIPGLYGNVEVTGSSRNYSIAFKGRLAHLALPDLLPNGSGLVGTNVTILEQTTTVGGEVVAEPVSILTSPNSAEATAGNDAHIRVILKGDGISDWTGLRMRGSNSIVRGLAIDGFSVGLDVEAPGVRVEGNFIGQYVTYPVDPDTGAVVSGSVSIGGVGNSGQGVLLGSQNAIVGGINPAEANVISGNGGEGIRILGIGNAVEGNQIGVISVADGRYSSRNGNHLDGVLILGPSQAGAGDGGSSNVIGTIGAGNVISANGGTGVRIAGAGATQNVLAANLIGLPPGGGYLFGTGNPGNLGDGVRIEDASGNQVGGPSAAWGNAIGSNGFGVSRIGDGVYVAGAGATGNVIAGNLIGLTSGGKAVRGNAGDGVTILAPQTTVGPGNVISGNTRGVHVSGVSGALIRDNLIGTDIDGANDLGNAQEGVLLENSPDATVSGSAAGSQVISGNLRGLTILGTGETDDLVVGNLIGTDRTGTAPLPNSQEGLLIDAAAGNTIGGTASSQRNVISANHWGVRLIDGASSNVLEGNLIGTDVTGTAALANETDGVLIERGASDNTVGGTAAGAGNILANNTLAGAYVDGSTSVGNSILSNSIFGNGRLGIDLHDPADPPSGVTPNGIPPRSGPNDLQNYPILTAAVGGSPSGQVQGYLVGQVGHSYLIQFFTSTVADPSGFGQGQTYLGSKVVAADATGIASIAFNPPAAIPANAWVTSTATDVQTGDTSEFSQGVSALTVSVQFAVSSYQVNATEGIASIEVSRIGNTAAQVSVSYATTDGTAHAGLDYRSVSGILTFKPGDMVLSFAVPILENIRQSAASTTVNLALASPTGGATLGSPATSTLVITNNLPPVVQFASSSYSVYTTSGSAIVNVSRLGGQRGQSVTVSYDTRDITAGSGDYTRVSGSLTFGPGQLTAAFAIPIVGGSHPSGVKTAGITLTAPVDVRLGSPSEATLFINSLVSTPADETAPWITSREMVADRGGIGSLRFTFSEPMNPSRAQDLGNFGYYVITAGRDRLLGTADDGHVSLASAVYDPASRSVVLTPTWPLPLNSMCRITIDGLADSQLGNGLTDAAGNLLADRQGGVPGSSAVVTFGAGTALFYRDSRGKGITLTLKGPGLIEMFQAAGGDVTSLALVGAVPRKSTLRGKANKAGGRYTYLPPIAGSSGVKLTFPKPPFVLQSAASAFRAQSSLTVSSVGNIEDITAAHLLARPVKLAKPTPGKR